MSKVVKVVAGVALLTVGVGGLLGFAGVQFGTSVIGGYALQAVSLLSGVSLVGSALAPELPDTSGADAYAGQKLQTKKDNVSAVPIIFGENRVGSNIIFQTANNYGGSSNNKHYWAIQVLSEGELENFITLYAGEDEMSYKGNFAFTTTYAHCRVYPTSGDSGTALTATEFAKNEAGDIINGQNADLANDNFIIPPNVAFIAVHQEYDATDNKHTQLDAITATVKGQKINDIKDDVVNNNIYYFSSGTYSSSSSGESNLFDGNISTTGYRVAGDNLSLDMDNRIQFNSTSSTSPRNQTLIISAEIYIKTDIGLEIFAKDADGTSFGDPVVVSAGYEGWITLDNSDALDWYSEEELSDYWDIIFTGSGTGSDLEVEIREIRNVEWLERDYSYNPASQVLNLLTKGLNIPPISIDYPSFINASQKCSSYGYSSNIVFNSQRNIQSCIVDILATCRGQIVLSQGKWKLKIDEKGSSVAKALTVGDILNGSLNVSMKGFQEIANKIELKYIEPNDNWLSAKASKEDSDLIAMDGQSNVKTLDIKGVTNSLQANKLAEITLNSMRYTEDTEGNRIKQAPLAISFATTVKNAELEVGDVISLDHNLLDRTRKFILLSVETGQGGDIQISAREYCETHYKNSAGVYLI
jgi:hypothetical protein